MTEPAKPATAKAEVKTFLVIMGVFSLLAVYSGVVGGALAFIVVFGIGFFIAFGVAGVIALFAGATSSTLEQRSHVNAADTEPQ